MLIELVGHNDAPVFVNPKHVRALEPGTTLGTTRVLLSESEALIVQGQLRAVAALLKREPGATARRATSGRKA